MLFKKNWIFLKNVKLNIDGSLNWLVESYNSDDNLE